jgi:hypothetical protein
MNSVELGMYRSIITTGWARTAEKSREVSRAKEKLRSGNMISARKNFAKSVIICKEAK